MTDLIHIWSIEDLRHHTDGKAVFIYGAKEIAERAFLTLSDWERKVPAFLVSERYENRSSIRGVPVLHIEKMEELPECIVIATVEDFMPDIVADLTKRGAKELLLLRAPMQDAFPAATIRTDRCRIAEGAMVSDGAEIFADDTSEIVIGEGAEIQAGSVLLASDHSMIHIGSNVVLEKHCRLVAKRQGALQLAGGKMLWDSRIQASDFYADAEGLIEIAGGAKIKDARWSVADHGAVRVGAYANFGASEFCVFAGGSVAFGENVFYYPGGSCGARHDGHIRVGARVDLGDAQLGCDGGDITIGDDSMFGGNTVIMAGSHPIYSIQSGKDITNRKPVHIGKHVWIGRDVTCLSGCKIGDGSIVDTRSLVFKEIPPNATCGGFPAHPIWRGVRWER